ncbi:zinc-dependent alcohol dehydrogenase family protein [Actinokineospora xionganensis]|uniref:Zinc-dependent alcohol dehydrogenase family protein n=1 Tax=Actinokineospora xionganensis TaxID=2684470 RepID=A0ABR7LAQ9_9PSEU|nr:zinc-dependent alcohol dehydrogenase family protein [Actinokineospora xionganensis]MBC6449804.1 zinc-dependent alcohol dehydrogenase family protein [Actinokineospora xionganensis]
MRAVVITEFGVKPLVEDVDEPKSSRDGVVVRVEATGVCRSDWHAWQGHDPSVALPHVAGHELAGRIVEVGSEVRGWRLDERVTVPFVCACGACPQCASGNQQVCDRQFQPGSTHWGSFAEFVALDHAEVNLVRLPGSIDSVAAAALGCRFGTAFRAVLRQGEVRPGQWVAVHGCGGAGISAVLIAVAAGARVVAVDLSRAALELVLSLGAEVVIDAGEVDDVAAAVREVTGGGAHVSLDCVGHPATCAASVACLRKRGRHVQVGLMPPSLGVAPIPMHQVIADELVLLGSHGVQAHEYPAMLSMVERAGMDLSRLVGPRISLDGVPGALVAMNDAAPGRPGVTVVDLTHESPPPDSEFPIRGARTENSRSGGGDSRG